MKEELVTDLEQAEYWAQRTLEWIDRIRFVIEHGCDVEQRIAATRECLARVEVRLSWVEHDLGLIETHDFEFEVDE